MDTFVAAGARAGDALAAHRGRLVTQNTRLALVAWIRRRSLDDPLGAGAPAGPTWQYR
jgi:hypothetical protein